MRINIQLSRYKKDLDMTDKVKIITAVAALIVAAGIFFITTKRDKPIEIDFRYKCTKCDKVLELSRNEVASKMAEMRAMYPDITPFAMPVMCPDCNEKSCRYALKCESCGEVFIYNQRVPQPDKCPKCGYVPSKAEDK